MTLPPYSICCKRRLRVKLVLRRAVVVAKEDGHPILLVTANNIATVLQQHGINSVDDVESWLREVDTKYQRM